MRSKPELSTTGRVLLLGGLLSVLCCALWWTPPMQELDRRIADSWYCWKTDQPSEKVVLVLIDDRSLERYGRWPWSRTLLADLIQRISEDHPKAIGLDILLSEPESEIADAKLIAAVKAAGNVVLVDKISNSGDGSLWVEPLPGLSEVAAAVGHAQAVLDTDGICRRFPLAEMSIDGPRIAFGLNVAAVASPDQATVFRTTYEKVLGKPLVAAQGSVDSVAPMLAPISFRQPYSGAESPFVTLSAADILNGSNPHPFPGKVVMVGFGSSDIHDRLMTPVSGTIPSPGVEIHAHIVDAILSGRYLLALHPLLQLLILVILGMSSVFAGIRFKPWTAVGVSLGLVLVSYGAGFLCFIAYHRIADAGLWMCLPLLAVPLVQIDKLVRVERSVARQLRNLQQKLRTTPSSLESEPADYNWRLQTLERLQNQLGSMYEFEHTLLETTQDCIAVFADSGSLLFCNARFRELCRNLHHAESVSLSQLSDSATNAGIRIPVSATELPFACEGLLAGTLWNLTMTRLPGDNVPDSVLLVMTNLQARLERDRTRSEALAFVTHELRTPLVSIQGFAEMMVRFPTADTSLGAPEIIFRETRRLVGLINAYLDMLRLESGARPLQIEPNDLGGIFQHVCKVLEPLAEASRVQLTELATPEGLRVNCDGTLLTGALMNLVSNAIKYGGEGCSVRLSASLNDQGLSLSVWNDGPEISKQDLDLLFNTFQRGSESSQQPGWGLGLAFVKRVVDQHRGQIYVSSSREQGTEFRIVLPSGCCVLRKEVGA